MGSIWNWSLTAADNATADDGINWAEGQQPSSVNNSARAMMERIAELLADLGGITASTNTANAYSLTANSAFTAYADGVRVSFRASATNTGASMLAVNSLAVKPIVKITTAGEVDVAPGEIQSNGIYELVYSTLLNANNGAWLLLNPSPASVLIGGWQGWGGSDLPDNFLWCDGSAISRTTYAALFAAIGTTNGDGDGSTTFNVPDFRGITPAGKDDMGGTAANRLTSAGSGIDGTTIGTIGGSETHTLTEAELPTITPTFTGVPVPDHSHQIDLYTSTGGSHNTGGGNNLAAQDSGAIHGAGGHTPSGTISSFGSGDAHSNVQPIAISTYIIRYQ